ncbi:MAG: hypothetical protein ACK5N0_15575 [Synechococcaceae cyanobacterium]
MRGAQALLRRNAQQSAIERLQSEGSSAASTSELVMVVAFGSGIPS